MRGYAVDEQTQEKIISRFYVDSPMLWYLSKERFCRLLGKIFHLHWKTILKIINNELNQN